MRGEEVVEAEVVRRVARRCREHDGGLSATDMDSGSGRTINHSLHFSHMCTVNIMYDHFFNFSPFREYAYS